MTEATDNEVSGAREAGLDPARFGRSCPDGNRPAREPGGCECRRCGCTFVGEEWHEFCAMCIAIVASEIAASQGRLVMREPEYPLDSGERPNCPK